VNSKGFVTIIISGIAALLFVLGFVTPFYWFLGDPMIFLAGYASLMLIVIAFVLNVKTGSHSGLDYDTNGRIWNLVWI
jgi:hypothetical protein